MTDGAESQPSRATWLTWVFLFFLPLLFFSGNKLDSKAWRRVNLQHHQNAQLQLRGLCVCVGKAQTRYSNTGGDNNSTLITTMVQMPRVFVELAGKTRTLREHPDKFISPWKALILFSPVNMAMLDLFSHRSLAEFRTPIGQKASVWYFVFNVLVLTHRRVYSDTSHARA